LASLGIVPEIVVGPEMAAENVVATYYYPTAAPGAMEVCGAELGRGAGDKCFDDDGRPKRSGEFRSDDALVVDC